MTDYWLQSALTNDVLVVELLLRVKHSSDSDLDSDSLRAPPPPTTATSFTQILPPRWGNRKNRSKSTAPTTTVTNGKEHRGSPTTHLSWSGGSTSDGYDESSRPSDLSSGSRSVKVNEGASTASCNKFEKRKSYVEHKDEESSLFNERIHINKLDLDQNQRNKRRVMGEQMKFQCCRVEAETEDVERGFVLPDLNMTPDENE